MNTQIPESLGNPPLSRATDRLSYSIGEVAELTGLGRTTLYQLIGQGELPSCKVGRRRLIRAADLEAFLDGAGRPARSN